MKFDIIGDVKDDRLRFLLEQVKTAVNTFVEAIRNSTEDQEGISYQAFTLKSRIPDEVKMVFDIIITAFIVEMKEQAEDLITKYTFHHSVEDKDTEEPKLFFHCRKELPPTKEEIEKLISKQEEEKKAVVPVIEYKHECPSFKDEEVVGRNF